MNNESKPLKAFSTPVFIMNRYLIREKRNYIIVINFMIIFSTIEKLWDENSFSFKAWQFVDTLKSVIDFFRDNNW